METIFFHAQASSDLLLLPLKLLKAASLPQSRENLRSPPKRLHMHMHLPPGSICPHTIEDHTTPPAKSSLSIVNVMLGLLSSEHVQIFTSN